MRITKKAVVNGIKTRLRKLFRRIIIKKPDFDKCIILANNCIAGYLYHDYGMQFCSPTINLQMSPEDFMHFCGNLQHYLNCSFVECHDIHKSVYKKFHRENDPFPIGKLDDLTVYFQHYHTFEEGVQAWERRCERLKKCAGGVCDQYYMYRKRKQHAANQSV